MKIFGNVLKNVCQDLCDWVLAAPVCSVLSDIWLNNWLLVKLMTRCWVVSGLGACYSQWHLMAWILTTPTYIVFPTLLMSSWWTYTPLLNWFWLLCWNMRLKSKKGHLVEIRILGSEECETETFEKAKQIIQEEKSLSYCDGSWYERFWPLLGLVPKVS